MTLTGAAGTSSAWAVVLAAGGGSRFGGAKQFARRAGEPLLQYAVRAAVAVCEGVVVVLPADRVAAVPGAARTVAGGATRSASVRAGLAAVPRECRIVVLHDAAHPLATVALFEAVIAAVAAGAAAAIPALPVTDAVKRVEADRVVASLGRAGLATAQMPQGFRADVLRAAHAAEPEVVEDSALIEKTGHTVVTVAGDPANIHVTTRAELAMAKRLAQR